jgi:tetratricopeptide (TPR) repeat protein
MKVLLRHTAIAAVALAALSAAPAARCQDDPYALEGRVMREPNNTALLIKTGKLFTRRFDAQRQEADLSKAEHYLERATRQDPNSPEAKARYAIARALRAREKNAKDLAKGAVKDLDAAVALEPSNPLLRALRGFVEVELPGDFNRMDQGLQDLQFAESALQKDPSIRAKYDLDVAKIYVKLGKAYRARGKVAEAKKSYEAAVSADPNSHEAKTAQKLLKKL